MTAIPNASRHIKTKGRVRRAWRRCERKRSRAFARSEIRAALAQEGF